MCIHPTTWQIASVTKLAFGARFGDSAHRSRFRFGSVLETYKYRPRLEDLTNSPTWCLDLRHKLYVSSLNFCIHPDGNTREHVGSSSIGASVRASQPILVVVSFIWRVHNCVHSRTKESWSSFQGLVVANRHSGHSKGKQFDLGDLRVLN